MKRSERSLKNVKALVEKIKQISELKALECPREEMSELLGLGTMTICNFITTAERWDETVFDFIEKNGSKLRVSDLWVVRYLNPEKAIQRMRSLILLRDTGLIRDKATRNQLQEKLRLLKQLILTPDEIATADKLYKIALEEVETFSDYIVVLHENSNERKEVKA